MTKRKRETAHKNVRRNYRKFKKKVATLLIRNGNVNTPFTQKIQAKF
jgi:hypothetical protein